MSYHGYDNPMCDDCDVWEQVLCRVWSQEDIKGFIDDLNELLEVSE